MRLRHAGWALSWCHVGERVELELDRSAPRSGDEPRVRLDGELVVARTEPERLRWDLPAATALRAYEVTVRCRGQQPLAVELHTSSAR